MRHVISTTCVFVVCALKLKNLRIVVPTLAIFVALVSVAQAVTLETIFDGGSRNFGSAFDVTNLSGSPISLTGAFEGSFNGGYNAPTPLPETEVWWRSGTLSTAALESASGWTLLGTDNPDPVGNEEVAAFDVGASLPLAAGETKGILVFVRGPVNDQPKPVVYTETGGGPNGTSYTDGTLQITNFYGMGISSVASPAYPAPDGNGINVNGRTWNGSIEYVPEPATLAMLVMALPLMLLRRRTPRRQ